ncbi:diguanylate cyclase (GGDEF)-like protein/PAS domain S-box-containing protein [Arthrobacter sp. PL16]|uniref:putative bifunctional diguanylate cyclase/phosphodiesterase n=1 Tax=Arthrobacter sp. PL16 TaxID=3071720 RepID=UPI002DFF9402|nr:diguanylate cyclase (GGDEF)-like protein/PAS domain S-box-containing protein [Arthrobacter sp. PL16]
MTLLTHESSDDGCVGSCDRGVGVDEVGFAEVLSEARAAAADIAVITDAAQRITFVSDAFAAMTGYDRAELLGQNCRLLQGPGTDPQTRAQIRDVLGSGEMFEGQILNYRKDGSAFWTALRIVPMWVGDSLEVTHFVSVQQDISNKVASLKHLENQALHDQVTGLPNRTMAGQAVERAVQRALDRDVTVAVALIDLDDFRIVNNTLGHTAGDTVLQQWATRMLSHLREGDTLARMGGDEFLLILNNIPRDTADNTISGLLGRIHDVVEDPFTVDHQHIRIGMSLGLALVPEDGTDNRTILRRATDALYTAKKRDRDTAPWWETAHQVPMHSTTHRTLEAGFSATAGAVDGAADGAGVGNDAGSRADDGTSLGRTTPEDYVAAIRRGNILVHLQPVMNLRDGSVHLFEALARLKLPGRVAYPDEFLPHLDTEDQRVLFTGVLHQALTVLAAWDRDGARHSVSVNLPPEILRDGTLPALVGKALHDHTIEPARLGLELLESQTMTLESQRAALQDLADLGVGLAMDDLGSGYSSLQRLSSFPFSAIKIDRGLFTHVYDRPTGALTIMATLIQMGRDLDMDVVIEGLEDESLTEAAIILGAPLGQGYHFARPLAPEKCLEWVDSFDLTVRGSSILTPLGALAYHWQLARLAAPHPVELEQCPLTQFLNTTKINTGTGTGTGTGAGPEVCLELGSEVQSWHALQHSTLGVHPVSSRLLTDWLTHHVCETLRQGVSDRTRTRAGNGGT